ncbi:beclin 1-associated autophagy-related key regulator-like, partial [Colias croceus]|uniref:beclin 1-associated autophagy-related key regulator-like n=1 Tax=Colias crocea TaxID=72248 RepID=UPI001E27FA0E
HFRLSLITADELSDRFLYSFPIFQSRFCIANCNVCEIRKSVAMSYLAESEAPRDFRVSSTESDGHYTKCVLCYTVKRNFYCAECVRSGSFVHSSLPYSDKFSDKQVKLMRLKLNRQHILDRCEKLLAPKLKKDILVTETKRSRDKLDLLRLAIDQRKNNISSIKKELSDLVTYNNELRLKLPRYQKRVSSLGKHAQSQRYELQKKISTYNDQAQSLAALRRSRIRQLNRYIFPVYISYDSSDSIEDMEFVGDDAEEEPPKRPQLHIVAPYVDIDGDYSSIQAWASANKEAGGVAPWANPVHRSSAALGLCAQLLALLAWTLDVRLPHAIALGEVLEGGASRWRWAVRRVAAAG